MIHSLVVLLIRYHDSFMYDDTNFLWWFITWACYNFFTLIHSWLMILICIVDSFDSFDTGSAW